MKRAFLLLLVACATAGAPQPPPPLVHGPKLIPAYEWDKDNTLNAFRGQMIELIRARDAKRLFDHVDPNVRISFGPGSGIEAFQRAWYIEPHWEEIYAIFYLGSGVLLDNDHFETPSLRATWPEKLDPLSFAVVMSRNTPLRESKDPGSKAMATLSFDIVKPLGEKGYVRVADGRTGWVDPRLVMSPAGYRVELVRKWGTWKIEALVSGR
ncbi:MAG TPA: hypothetical protein VGA84_05040 [Thermoanaerobaculia bacterium]